MCSVAFSWCGLQSVLGAAPPELLGSGPAGEALSIPNSTQTTGLPGRARAETRTPNGPSLPLGFESGIHLRIAPGNPLANQDLDLHPAIFLTA